MAIKAVKVTDDVFVSRSVMASRKDLEKNMKEYLSRVGKVEPLIQDCERAAHEILKAKGYPTTWKELSWALNKGEHPRQLRDIEDMLFRFKLVRFYLKESKVEIACWNMALAITLAMKAEIRKIKTTIKRGVDFKIGRDEGFQAKVTNPKEVREAFANWLTGGNRKHSASQVAMKVKGKKRAIDFIYGQTLYKIYKIAGKDKNDNGNYYIVFESPGNRFEYAIDAFKDTIKKIPKIPQ